MIIVTDNGPVDVGEPPTRPLTNRPPVRKFGFHWVGTDGTEWNLCAGPAEILSGARGFGMPTPQHWHRQALGDGAAYNGTRVPPREVYMPVELLAPANWLDVDRSFFAGLNPRAEGRLRVTTPTAEWRELVCRYVEGAEGEYETDPLLVGRAVYPIRMIAADPYWRGAPVVRTYRTQSDTARATTFPPAGSPLSLYFPRADSLDGEGEITNPGDTNAYAVWRVTAPFTGFEVGIGDQFVKMTLTKASGHVTIDTTGGMTTMIDETGANVRSYADDFKSPPIPPGDTTLKLVVFTPGAGSEVEVSFQPRYYRAW